MEMAFLSSQQWETVLKAAKALQLAPACNAISLILLFTYGPGDR